MTSRRKRVAKVNLQIRDPRAHRLARQLAEKRRVSMTEAVIAALEAELRRDDGRVTLRERLASVADDLRAKGKAEGRRMSDDEVDAMWGQA